MTPMHLKRQRGVSLVEVLVTVLLVSIGLLGVAGLQLSTVQNANSAAQRFEATVLARDILERMRANRARALAGDYNLDLDADAPGSGGLAGSDLQDWLDRLALIPGGDGAVEVEGGVATITVQWSDASDDNAGGETVATLLLRTNL